MAVTKRRAMQMFDRDLEVLMDDLRGMQTHYNIDDWEAFVFLRKPDCPESYVVKYAAANDQFAKRIVRLHSKFDIPAKQLWESRVCQKCGHDERLLDTTGRCGKQVDTANTCGCKCEFSAPVATADNEGVLSNEALMLKAIEGCGCKVDLVWCSACVNAWQRKVRDAALRTQGGGGCAVKMTTR